MPIAEHLAGFIADFGVPCSKAAYAFTAILDMPGEMLNLAGVNVINNAYLLTMLSADAIACSLITGDALVVGGAGYTVRDIMAIDDGAFTHVTLSQ